MPGTGAPGGGGGQVPPPHTQGKQEPKQIWNSSSPDKVSRSFLFFDDEKLEWVQETSKKYVLLFSTVEAGTQLESSLANLPGIYSQISLSWATIEWLLNVNKWRRKSFLLIALGLDYLLTVYSIIITIFL